MPENSELIPNADLILNQIDFDRDALKDLIERSAKRLLVGDGVQLFEALQSLPDIRVESIQLDKPAVSASSNGKLEPPIDQQLLHGLQQLIPWRKGPFDFFGNFIDAEWRSDWKWDRISAALGDLREHRVMDVGCGNGYYMFRMAQSNPKFVLGIEPFQRYVFQFQAFQKYANLRQLEILPANFNEIPIFERQFDDVVCMGVLYHNRSPLDFLSRLRQFLRPGGKLILETLTIEGDDDIALCPQKRYAKMHNCFFLPTEKCLANWLLRSHFENIECIDSSVTNISEQRKTEWMLFESLSDFLDPKDSSKTIEGYPSPRRSVFVGTRRHGV